ncbi:hypothetical protein [Virgibacillus pantothenticus]|nr:hypothetical protein [Virgibacillus pantothenticus]MEB5470591.1 hypothetical protein [Virgibacillus pantothenticus]
MKIFYNGTYSLLGAFPMQLVTLVKKGGMENEPVRGQYLRSF